MNSISILRAVWPLNYEARILWRGMFQVKFMGRKHTRKKIKTICGRECTQIVCMQLLQISFTTLVLK